MLKQGYDHLQVFYEKRSATMDPSDQVEVDFISQQIVINGASITGKIDRLQVVPNSNQVVICDFKTGKIFDNWDPSDEYLQMKAWNYRLQLVFYKILVENSRYYRGKIVQKGVLDFLKPRDNDIFSLDAEITEEETERVKKLIGIVYGKIMRLDFPDISKYDKDLFGIGVFTEDLLNGRT